MINEQITTLIEKMKDTKKRARQKAVDEMLQLIQENGIEPNLLKEALLGDNLNVTSSVIQIMCRLGADETKQLLYWLKEYRDLYNPILDEYEWLRLEKEDKGERIYSSIKKYVKQNIRFQDLIEFLQQLYAETIILRRGLISEIRENYTDLIQELALYFIIHQKLDWTSITEDTYKKAERMEVEDDAAFRSKLPIILKETYLYKLYFYQFWLHLLRELSFDFVHNASHEPVFPIDEILILKEDSCLDKICCPNSRFRRLVLEAIKQLPDTNYMILRSIETSSNEYLWKTIADSQNWYKITTLADYSEHPASQALQALLILGDKEALFLFKDICEYYDANENGVPNDAFKIYQRFTLPEVSNAELNDDPNIQIGNRWEEICRALAKHFYGNIMIHPQLPNGFVPDIAVDQHLKFEKGELVRAEILIECKKSEYFLYNELPPNRQQPVSEYNNAVTAKYKPYCERLEFWLFEDNDIFNKGNASNREVVVRYASDFLNDLSIPNEIKNQITDLITFSQQIFEEVEQQMTKDPISEAQRGIYELYKKQFYSK